MNSIMFGVQGMVYRRLEPGLKSLFLSGAVGGLAQSIIVSPMELVKLQMQLQGQGVKYKHIIRHTPDEMLRFNGSWDCFEKLFKTGGVRGIYRGFVATAAREGPGVAIYFVSYHTLCSKMAKSYDSVDQLGVFRLLLAGGCAGSLSWITTYPVDVVKSRFQADLNGKYTGLFDCARQAYSSKGMPVFFRGLSTALVRAFPVNAATLATFTLILRSGNGVNQ